MIIMGGTGQITNSVTSNYFSQGEFINILKDSGLVLAQSPALLDISFWQQIVATLLGAAIGIPIALTVNRQIENTKKKKEKSDLLKLFKEALQKNKKLLKQMLKELDPSYVIFYNVDISLLDSTASLKYELIDNLELNRRLDALRYELDHIHRKVNLQLETVYSAFKAMSNYQKTRKNLIDSIRVHLPQVINEIDNVVELLDSELG